MGPVGIEHCLTFPQYSTLLNWALHELAMLFICHRVHFLSICSDHCVAIMCSHILDNAHRRKSCKFFHVLVVSNCIKLFTQEIMSQQNKALIWYTRDSHIHLAADFNTLDNFGRRDQLHRTFLTNLTKVRPLFTHSHRGSENFPLLIMFK